MVDSFSLFSLFSLSLTIARATFTAPTQLTAALLPTNSPSCARRCLAISAASSSLQLTAPSSSGRARAKLAVTLLSPTPSVTVSTWWVFRLPSASVRE